MTTLHRTLRALAAGLLLLAFALAVLLFAASRMAERALRTERQFGAVHVLVHGPSVSPFFTVRADSIVLRSPAFRLEVNRPFARLLDWGALRFREERGAAAVFLRADSMALEILPSPDSAGAPVEFPNTLRFPVGVALEWRVLTVRAPGMPVFTAGPARWRTRGSQAVRGTFRLAFPLERAPELDAKLNARWRGPALRYRLEASDPSAEATLLLSGIREKRNLRAGYDSLELFAAHPDRWLAAFTPSHLPGMSDLRVAGKADWRHDSLRFSARVTTEKAVPLQPAVWKFAARLGAGGGRFVLHGAGKSQSMEARGGWSHPGEWLSFPPWETWRGEFSGQIRGGDWMVGPHPVPLDFNIPVARLDTGLRLKAQVETRAASRFEAFWNGRRPGRLEFAGDVSPAEGLALVWTDTNISYRAARVEGAWEHSRMLATARIRNPRAYGTIADSLEAVNEVTSSGYFLRSGRVYRDGEVFTGSGQVLWKNSAGDHAVSLRFAAAHDAHGRAAILMPRLGHIQLTADSLRPARFPYEPARRLAHVDPLVHGRLEWDRLTGSGEAVLSALLTANHGTLDASADATWTRDSLRVRNVAAATRGARVEAEAVLPFDGRGWAGPWDAHRLMGGAWRVRATDLDPAAMYAFTGRPTGPFRGVVNGELTLSPARGLAGEMRMDSLRLPAGAGVLEVTAVKVNGLGDSLRVETAVATRTRGFWSDTVLAVFSSLNADTPRFRIETKSTTGLSARIDGAAPGWRRLEGDVVAQGRLPLGEGIGMLEDIRIEGGFSAPLNRSFAREMAFTGRGFGLRHVSSHDTQVVSGMPTLAGGVLRISDLKSRNARGEGLAGWLEADLPRRTLRGELAGSRVNLILPGGQKFQAQEFSSVLSWNPERGLAFTADARAGSVALPPSPWRVETGFDFVHAEVTLPPAHAVDVAPTLTARGRLHDFLFQRKWGWRDATAYFTAFNRGGARAAGGAKRARPWQMDVDVEAAGARNHINTDVLRMNFTGDARITGAYPYMLVRGKVSGVQGEVGQVRQSYVLRDFEVKWDNVSVEDGTLYAEGEKRLRADCRPDTRQTCQIYIRLDGRLEDVGFTYETDCGQNSGEQVAPSVLINSMAQGCYVSETPGGEGNYGSAAFAMLEPALNARLSREFSRGSGGFIKSTQVSGLSALIGSDSSGLESVALEVESREVHRVGLKGRAGYHPETKLANPMEYRMAAEYRPPLDRLATDSAWQARLKNRFTVEAAVETRPEGRDIEEERRVRQRAGLRYRYRFWDLW